jgi:Arm DNA-binding domain/Phage integrase, N-terminal SAM-like domain
MPNPNDADGDRKSHIKITKRSVESLGARETGSVIRYDEKLAGFGVRVMPSGHRSYFIRYRNKHGRSRWFTIGEHGKITAEAARRAAQRILQAVAVDGSDPPGEREAFRAAPTVNDLLDRYIKEHLEQRCRLRTIESFKGVVERDIRPELGHLKVAAVRRQDMHKLHAAKSETPRQANMVLSVCSKVFNLAETWEMRPEGTNPCRKIERYRENHRERFLSGEELARLGATLRRAENGGRPSLAAAKWRRVFDVDQIAVPRINYVLGAPFLRYMPCRTVSHIPLLLFLVWRSPLLCRYSCSPHGAACCIDNAR